jgi:hypothetical protein
MPQLRGNEPTLGLNTFGGLPYTEMLNTITSLVMYDKELENCLEDMKFH